MSGPLQFLNHSDPGRLATRQSKGLHEAKSSKVKHLSVHTSQKTSPVACFDLPFVVPTKNAMMYNKRAADPVRPDLTGLLVKNKNLLAELRNLQNKLLIKETSLQEMKNELESYKENNVQQSFQIMSLKDDIKDLEELIASLTRIKSLKNTNIQNLERGNWDLTERIIELENRLRVHLFEREKAERKAGLLEKKLAGTDGFTPYMNMKGQEDPLDSFMKKDKGEAILTKNFERDIFHSEGPKDGRNIWNKRQEDSIHKEKQKYELDRPPHSFGWETKTARSHYQKFLSQLATLLSNSVVPIPATEQAVKERIQEIGAKERSWKFRTEGLQQEILTLTQRLQQLPRHSEEAAREPSQMQDRCREQKRALKRLEGKTAVNDFFQESLDLDRNKENSGTKNSWTDEHGKMSRQLEKDNEEQTLLNIQQNLQIATTQRLEEKIQKLQKQLSDLKLSNKSMKIQLTRVNVLKNKTIEKLRQSLTRVEAMKGKAVMKTDNLKTTLDSAKEEARGDKEKVHQLLDTGTPAEFCTAKGTLDKVPGQKHELSDFRETIMKMLGFNMRTADKEIINHLRLIIQDYEASNKSKIASDCETGQDNK
ncbi:coiled-coil domain-containing protein 170-like isoform X1 [Zalophus californianus]|uniref:Coiled-coil domain-containing protein 170-like isoform X1 n=2 Tax=Zalophus californianus TaxID=9704 RepID=A0A6J2B4T5_ZALCA|nr:coiled-coil domain-containing protein 170-like isoform X1 [Zalophus californianus]XP_027426991.1 coiled-coil domain-containing protein 170-like isoform X1 [Zalophus californianus]XP_027426992.1 coiled-coil domain-containing protein 170-like isoform X1 [Zalophus californianus]XP_027426993.1 coiled-coil domain-containing protein 170-like isoform X1 [Zalophus californianus]XP_027426994.1 coiled-coil domain-containing protein 170-like isoform X1 [Zalophus californianus]XP_027426995.1 coiled-coi